MFILEYLNVLPLKKYCGFVVLLLYITKCVLHMRDLALKIQNIMFYEPSLALQFTYYGHFDILMFYLTLPSLSSTLF